MGGSHYTDTFSVATADGTRLVITVTMQGGSVAKQITMQWDDRFYSGAVTTDLNWYLFNAAGNCSLTFAANNFTQDNGIEFPRFTGGTTGTYRIMVARTTPGAHSATRVRLLNPVHVQPLHAGPGVFQQPGADHDRVRRTRQPPGDS